MRNYICHIKLLCERLLIVFAFMTLTRLLFYFMNEQHFDLSFGELVKHLAYGLKFDIVSVSLANLLSVPMSVVPGRILSNKTYQKVLKVIFIIPNILIIACNFIDCKFYEWEEKRLTADILTPEWLGNDFITLLPQFLSDYWPLFAGFAASVAMLIWLYPQYKETNENVKNNAKDIAEQSAIALSILALTAIGGRGSIGMKPLRIISAAQYTTPERIPLILNSSFTIFKTISHNTLPQYNYFSNDILNSVYTPLHSANAKNGNKKNVVIIILESFGREYSAFLNNSNTGYTPCLDSIMKKGAYFVNAFANGKRSIEALPSIMASIPPLLDEAFITSPFTSNKIDGIASVLKKEGYHSAFFHGAKNGSMGFDNFAKLAGFDEYHGMTEYGNNADYDGDWGIFDEPFLQYMADELSTMKQPFLAGVFTLSSHHPYIIPEQHCGLFPKGTLVNHESIGYADYALGQFFKAAEETDWYNNTLFVLTADHTAQSESEYYQSIVGRYAIPLVLFCPSDTSLHGQKDKIVQQCDIMPTILEYVGHKDPYIAFGNNILDSTDTGFSVSFINGLYQIITQDKCISYDGIDIVASYKIKHPDTNGLNKYQYILRDSIVPYTVPRAYTRYDSTITNSMAKCAKTNVPGMSDCDEQHTVLADSLPDIVKHNSTWIPCRLRSLIELNKILSYCKVIDTEPQLIETVPDADALKKLKAIMQQYNFRMKQNNMSANHNKPLTN